MPEILSGILTIARTFFFQRGKVVWNLLRQEKLCGWQNFNRGPAYGSVRGASQDPKVFSELGLSQMLTTYSRYRPQRASRAPILETNSFLKPSLALYSSLKWPQTFLWVSIFLKNGSKSLLWASILVLNGSVGLMSVYFSLTRLQGPQESSSSHKRLR